MYMVTAGMFPALKLLAKNPSKRSMYTSTDNKKTTKSKTMRIKGMQHPERVSMVIQRDSKALLLLEHEATPRDLTAVSATGWEVLPGSQMLLGKCIQYNSTSGSHGCHWNVGKQCDMMDKRLLGLYVPHPSFQLIGKNSWKGGVLERTSHVKQLKGNFSKLLNIYKNICLLLGFFIIRPLFETWEIYTEIKPLDIIFILWYVCGRWGVFL